MKLDFGGGRRAAINLYAGESLYEKSMDAL